MNVKMSFNVFNTETIIYELDNQMQKLSIPQLFGKLNYLFTSVKLDAQLSYVWVKSDF